MKWMLSTIPGWSLLPAGDSHRLAPTGSSPLLRFQTHYCCILPNNYFLWEIGISSTPVFQKSAVNFSLIGRLKAGIKNETSESCKKYFTTLGIFHCDLSPGETKSNWRNFTLLQRAQPHSPGTTSQLPVGLWHCRNLCFSLNTLGQGSWFVFYLLWVILAGSTSTIQRFKRWTEEAIGATKQNQNIMFSLKGSAPREQDVFCSTDMQLNSQYS